MQTTDSSYARHQPLTTTQFRKLVQKQQWPKLHKESVRLQNCPDYTHLPAKEHGRNVLINELWELTLQDANVNDLHRSCANLTPNVDTLPRQTLAFLISQFTDRHNISSATLAEHIQLAGESVHKPGLNWVGKDNQQVFNLLALSDSGLYQLYIQIPSHLRTIEIEKPKQQEATPCEPRESGERKLTKRQKRQIAKFQKAAQKRQKLHREEVVVEESVAWAQCDTCNKWRRLLNTCEDDVPDDWHCSMHADNITCETPEEQMDIDEKWDGKTKGTKLMISVKNGVTSAAVLDDAGNPIPNYDGDDNDNDNGWESEWEGEWEGEWEADE